MSKALLDNIELITGRLTERRLSRIHEISEQTFEGWCRELGQLRGKLDAVPRKSPSAHMGSELRPYIRWPAYDKPETFLRFLMQQLLYCHSVAIDDPVTAAIQRAEDRTWMKRAGITYDAASDVNALLGALTFLAMARPLVKSGILVLLPSDESGKNEWWYRNSGGKAPRWYSDIIGHPGPDQYEDSELDRPVQSFTNNLITDKMREMVSMTHYESERREILDAIDALMPAIHRFISTHGAVDFPVPDDGLRQVAFAELFGQEVARAGFQSNYSSLNALRVSALGRLDVPTFDDLTFCNLVKLHEDSDAFTQWRIALGSALDMVREYQESGNELIDTGTQQRFYEMLYPAVNNIKQATPSLKSIAVDGVQALAVGSIPVAAAIISQSPDAGFAAAGVASAFTCAWTYSASRRKRRIGSLASSLLPKDAE